MTKAKFSGPFIRHCDGFWQEWFVRRSEFEVNVYTETAEVTPATPDTNASKSFKRGELVSELSYPRIAGIGITDFQRDASALAKIELEERKKIVPQG